MTNFRQIKIDVIRTQPEVNLFSLQPLQTMMIRILFIWSMRHPASAYVQGINDLAAPLILVFLGSIVQSIRNGSEETKIENVTTAHVNAKTSIYQEITEAEILSLKAESFLAAEADAFWCLSKLIDDI